MEELCSDFLAIIDPNICDSKGYTALHYAIDQYRSDIADKIIDYFKDQLDLKTNPANSTKGPGVADFGKQKLAAVKKIVDEIMAQEEGERDPNKLQQFTNEYNHLVRINDYIDEWNQEYGK
eukprot:CAMPEP_0202962522 /NCGR_PEP_ID=MMETSP1396-20130829/6629_1 /ASSEMBLY_ACC=CAM_ASM_000872 /TAXON_ID= /ORGANISM="Pseudokeronopsis sp., Strain Brazil" /LENGTH=120 /DNA_ID=CAMNT_0049683171 /DNA_START=742 /DNA_END=1104 /DNA_ORIENTATION=+